MYETYYTHSTYSLLGMAREFLTLVAALNGSPNVDYERISMSAPPKTRSRIGGQRRRSL